VNIITETQAAVEAGLYTQQHTIPAIFQRNAQTVCRASWVRTGTFTVPFAALTIARASRREIPAVDTDVTAHVQKTH